MKNLHSAFRIPYSALALLVAIFLAVGCAKESLNPDQTDAILALSHFENPETPDPDPEVDCKCYMRVIGMENPGDGAHWILYDTINLGMDYYVSGGAIGWIPPEGGQHPFPSPFMELGSPSNGWHTFDLLIFTGAPAGFKIHTEVRCYLQNGDGSQTLLTTTYHTFDFYEGVVVPPYGSSELRRFRKFFSCLVQTDDPPKDTAG